jgi:hypothetical protein
MSRFLKLTNIIINKNVIHDINKDKILIHLMAPEMTGSMIFGSGYCESRNSKLEICKTENFGDYKIVTNWIDNELK